MTGTIAYFDQMQGANYQMLSGTGFQLGIVDPDDSQLTTSQIGSLQSSGKSLIAYLSIGEAENYRSYWQSSWNSSPPSFILGENPDWPGNYEVKFWDPAWQKIVIDRAVSMAQQGYNGLMLDVVDVYDVAAVANADGGIANARADMEKFVEAISAATKAINPNFKIIQNNALDLLTTNPDDPTSATNTAYLSHIDGVVAESTFYNPDNSATTWKAWNVQYLEHAVSDGKPVLAIDYPTSSSAQQSFITQAVADGFVPFVGNYALNGIPSVNSQIPADISASALSSLLSGLTSVASGGTSGSTSGGTTSGSTGGTTSSGTGGTTSGGTSGGTTPTASNSGPGIILTHSGGYTVIKIQPGTGNHTLDGSAGNDEFTFYKHTGNTTVDNYTHGDLLNIESKIYSSASAALSHVTYNGSDAHLALDSGSSITLAGVGNGALTTTDFHIFS
ncbi:MAG: endo alpha-1,4 polygalactosaminidase [Pseudomonadota bacterium]|nr:endo alpha-1,4 polygalactosaminidase [Pseudomonadota bacterium]